MAFGKSHIVNHTFESNFQVSFVNCTLEVCWLIALLNCVFQLQGGVLHQVLKPQARECKTEANGLVGLPRNKKN